MTQGKGNMRMTVSEIGNWIFLYGCILSVYIAPCFCDQATTVEHNTLSMSSRSTGQEYTVSKGSNVTMTCPERGYAAWTQHLPFDDVEINSGVRIISKSDNANRMKILTASYDLYIRNVSEIDQGSYSCSVNQSSSYTMNLFIRDEYSETQTSSMFHIVKSKRESKSETEYSAEHTTVSRFKNEKVTTSDTRLATTALPTQKWTIINTRNNFAHYTTSTSTLGVSIQQEQTTTKSNLELSLQHQQTTIKSTCGLCNCPPRESPNLQDIIINKSLQLKLEDVKERLAVEKSMLSSSKRKKISATDIRTSAQSIGYVGAVLLVVTISVVVISDAISAVTYMMRRSHIEYGRGTEKL